MGKGDKRTVKGKTFSGSYGNVRPHKVAKAAVMPKATPVVRKAPAKKAAAKKA